MKKRIKGSADRPRFYVFRSNKHIYAQIIDDTKNHIITSSSSIAKDLKIKQKITFRTTSTMSKIIGHDIALKAINRGITQVVFDRGNNLYHGQIKALADAAREKGINF
uniref:Large ribosomal subunit protein uL18c n=1 Tax=Mastocarpus papillatus TaxID=31436 RepID=A0A342RZG4_9FLOR|nr:50S ribosomal protein L18 [Mastocarpus papillatus]AOL58110.1 50S ribosomal protein L18 [Mastocarpus papillatus]